MLVIFDCDGVLVDSENLASQVFSAQLKKVGIHKTAEECLSSFKGFTLIRCLGVLTAEYGGVIPATFIDELKVATQDSFDTHLQVVTGIESVLEQLTAQGIEFCVASNGGYSKIEHSLKVTGLWPYFEGRCFSAESVTEGKPAPDLFLWAAQEMGFQASDSVIIEDSDTGVSAGVAAGMRVLHFVSTTELHNLSSKPTQSSSVRHFCQMQRLSSLLFDC